MRHASSLVATVPVAVLVAVAITGLLTPPVDAGVLIDMPPAPPIHLEAEGDTTSPDASALDAPTVGEIALVRYSRMRNSPRPTFDYGFTRHRFGSWGWPGWGWGRGWGRGWPGWGWGWGWPGWGISFSFGGHTSFGVTPVAVLR